METDLISEVPYFWNPAAFLTRKTLKKETFDTAITDMSAWSLNYWLPKFV